MTKQHIAIKNIRNEWKKVFYCGYCDLHDIYYHETPQFYNAGVYGWNCDIYCDYARDIAITTGYRNMAGRRIPDELIKKYDGESKVIFFVDVDSTSLLYDQITINNQIIDYCIKKIMKLFGSKEQLKKYF